MGKDKLIVLNRERSKLPYELPPNLIYWIKCETRFKPLPFQYTEDGDEFKLISEEELQ